MTTRAEQRLLRGKKRKKNGGGGGGGLPRVRGPEMPRRDVRRWDKKRLQRRVEEQFGNR